MLLMPSQLYNSVIELYNDVFWRKSGDELTSTATFIDNETTPSEIRGGSREGGFQGFNPPPPRTAQLIVKFGEKVLQIDYRYRK